MKKRFSLKRVLGALLIVYVALLGIIFAFQRNLMYHPDHTDARNPAAYGLPEFAFVDLTPYYRFRLNGKAVNESMQGMREKKAFAWWYPQQTLDAPIVLYFHGNAQNISSRAKRFKALKEAGYGVLAISYTGYGGASGQPTEEQLYKDARAMLGFLLLRGTPPSKMIFVGESLGSGVATQMATEITPRALILDCPFTSVAERSQEIYPFLPAKWMVWDRYDNAAKIRQVKAPILILGATEDRVVPVHHAEALAKIAGPNATLKIFDHIPHVGLPAPELAAIIRAFVTPAPIESAPHVEQTDSPPAG